LAKNLICKFFYRSLAKILIGVMSTLPFVVLASDMTINDQEMQDLARDFRLEIAQSPSILHAPLANDYIQHLGKTLARHTEDRNIHYAFFINNSNEINAFAGPGGTIVINSGLILATNKEDELAAVLAHEIAHSEQKHWLKDLNRQKNMRIPMIASSLAAIALGLINPALGGSALAGSMSGYAQKQINVTRSHEEEADRIGIKLLYAADFNPQGMVDFLKELQKADQYHDLASIPPILLDHPLDEVRISDAQNRVEQLPKKYYIVNKDFFIVKEIIRVLTASNPGSLIHYYQQQLIKSPHNNALQYGYALTLMKTLKFSLAKPKLESLLRQSPRNYYYLLALSGCELGLKNSSKGLTLLQKLYDEYPDNLAIISDYSTALIQFNQYKKAENIIEDGLEEYPNNPILFKNLAQAQARNGETARAYLTRAKILIQLGQTREAAIALHSALKSVHNDPLLAAQIKAELKVLKNMPPKET
jgi:predicted Zn-dependent protease